MKMTRHNGRSGKNGIFTVKHNDRDFDLTHADHIDADRTDNNLYWDVYNGIHSSGIEDESLLAETFEEVERRYYADHYQAYVDGQNARNAKTRHTERNRSTEDIRHARKTCPEESIFQLGTMEDHAPANVLMEVAKDFMAEFERRYGSHIHIIDWALHTDESSPHIHERHIFDAENQHGELCPQQEKALEDLGFDPPDPSQKVSRKNNRKMVFDSACRSLMFEICRKHGLKLEEEPTYGGRQHLEKQDFIIQQQQKQIEKQQEIIDGNNEFIAGQNSQINSKEKELTELATKIEDLDSFIDEISEVAYDNAVETVTAVACAEIQKEDMKIISSCKEWLTQPDRQAPKEYRDYSAKRLDAIIRKIQKASTKIFEHVKQILTSPQKRRSEIEQIKEKTRESIRNKLSKKKKEVEIQEVSQPERFIEHQHQRVI